MSLSKKDQLKKNKTKTDLTEKEKTAYFTWIKENKCCLVCGGYPEVHHVTNKSIKGPRRSHKRVVPLCFNHHSAQSEHLSIHNDTSGFYKCALSLRYLLLTSKNMYQEYQND